MPAELPNEWMLIQHLPYFCIRNELATALQLTSKIMLEAFQTACGGPAVEGVSKKAASFGIYIIIGSPEPLLHELLSRVSLNKVCLLRFYYSRTRCFIAANRCLILSLSCIRSSSHSAACVSIALLLNPPP